MRNPFRYFKTSPEIIRLAVMMYIRFPLSLRNVEDLLHERGIDITHETVRFWWNRFGPLFAKSIRKWRVEKRFYSNWTWRNRPANPPYQGRRTCLTLSFAERHPYANVGAPYVGADRSRHCRLHQGWQGTGCDLITPWCDRRPVA